MRILLLGHREIACNLAMNILVSRLSGHELRIALSGEGGLHARVLVPDLVDLDRAEQAMCDLLDSSGREGFPGSFGVVGFPALAARTGRGLEVLEQPNAPEGLARLRAWAPELVLSVRYRKILHDEAISIPTFGVLNLHSGLLPDFRGVMATFHAMKAGVSHIGSTLHWIQDRGIDTGRVLSAHPVPVDYQASYLDNVLRLYPSGCAAMVEAVERLVSGNPLITKHQSGSGRYYSGPGADDCDAFREAGLKLFDGQELLRNLSLFKPAP